VPEDSTQPTTAVLEMIGAFKTRNESNVDAKGIRKGNPEGKVKPSLEGPEISRLKQVFGLMKDVLNPKPEAKRLESTKAASIGKVEDMQNSKVVATQGPKKSWLKLLLFGLGVAAAAWIAQFIDGVTEWGIKTLLKVKLWFKPLTNIITSMGTKFWKFIKGFKPVLKIIDNVAGWFTGLTTAIKGSKAVGSIMKMGGGSLMTIIKTAGRSVGAVLMKFGRFLPWIGSIFSFGFAIAKYIKGDLVGGTLELISGIVNLIPGGVFVSALLDGYILYRDFTSGKDTESGVDPESGEPGMLSKIWTSVSGWFSENYKKLPIIGSIVKMGEAAGHLLKGEWLPGFRALSQIMPSLLGGSIGGDLAGKGFDFVMGLFETEDSEVSSESGESGMLSKIWTNTKSWFSENYKKLPIIGGIVKMGEAAVHLLRGEWFSGFRALYQIIPSLLGGSIGGDLASRGFNFVMGLFETEDSIDHDSINTDTDGNSFSTMIGNMFSSIGDILGNIWGGIKNKVKMWGENTLSAVKDVASDVSSWVTDKLSAVGDVASDANNWIADKTGINIQDQVSAAASTAGDAASDANNWIADKTGINIQDEVSAAASAAASAAGDAVDDAWNKGRDLLGFEYGGVVPGQSYTGDKVVARVNSGEMVLNQKQQANLFKQANGGQSNFSDGRSIDKLLDANSVVMGELNNVNKNQLNVLISIRDGINMLVSNAGSNTATGGSTANGGSTEVQSTTNPLTQEFYA